MPAALTDSSQIICEVWASNVEEEMRKIRQIIQSYNYVAMVGKRVSGREPKTRFNFFDLTLNLVLFIFPLPVVLFCGFMRSLLPSGHRIPRRRRPADRRVPQHSGLPVPAAEV